MGAQFAPLSTDLYKYPNEHATMVMKSGDAVISCQYLLPAFASAFHEKPLSTDNQICPLLPSHAAAILLKSGEAVIPHQLFSSGDIAMVLDG